MAGSKKIKQTVLFYLLLAAVTLALYWPVTRADFINFDDNLYVTDNARIQSGITPASLAWAFTTGHASNWHPLTWISHMLDWQCYGASAGGHHLTNLLFHIANALLLFGFLQITTGAFWRGALVAALFAWHPVHVESVAWISERKDVLSTCCWLSTMLAYVWYVRRPGWLRYMLVLVLFMLGLLAKPMVVTLPIVLLLLDFWPLQRTSLEWKPNQNLPGFAQWKPLLLEKLPMLALAGIASLITVYVQSLGGAVAQLHLSITARVANALLAYVRYFGKIIWPENLAVFYPYHSWSWWQVAAAILLLSALLVLTVRQAKNHPYLFTGWLWYLITLLPVIGLIQVGEQALADRYAYIPSIGLFIMLAWGIPDILTRQSLHKFAWVTASSLALVGCIICTMTQLRYWQNSSTLFTHALAVTEKNTVARNYLAQASSKSAKLDETIRRYSEELRRHPDSDQLHNDLGLALATRRKYREATNHYAAALQLNPKNAMAHLNYGMTLATLGQLDEATSHYRAALDLKPDYSEAVDQLALALAQQGKSRETMDHTRVTPKFAPASPSSNP
ncbi:MAG: Tetratricopeptide 2 repeat protein [Pedosphaera sp.]|nr:Tetratricopeptide 2 repeat protein [Pedosphaera sp.]